MDLLNKVWDILNSPLIEIGQAQISLWSLIYIAILFAFVLLASTWIKRRVLRRFVRPDQENIGVWEAAASIGHYLVITIAAVVIFQTAGLDLSFLAVFGGALGIGLGFGLQTITNNFVSGIIILFERPIKVGDRIDVGNVTGRVTRIAIRATTILTNDNIAIIVPNSEFVSSRVINWSHTDPIIRFRFPYCVSYFSDPEKVKMALLEVAKAHKGILEVPAPSVQMAEFGDSSVNFSLLVWTREYSQKKGSLQSDLNFAVHSKFKTEGIEIPFPQRDVHVRMVAPPGDHSKNQ